MFSPLASMGYELIILLGKEKLNEIKIHLKNVACIRLEKVLVKNRPIPAHCSQE